MKAKKISFKLLVFIIALCVTMLTGVLLFGNVSTLVASAAEISAVNYDSYTDSDTLLGGTNTIRDYASLLHHSTVSWNGTKYSVTADDPIVQIVPKSLFATKGEYLHIGKEYGFFVKTTADTYYSVHTSNTVDPYNNHVEVLIFDITTDTDIKNAQTPDLITIKVEPLFQYRYAYIDYRSTKFFSDNNIVVTESFYVPYSIGDGETFVVPKPISTNSASFNQTWNYFLKNISISSTLLNEQELNETDDGYLASNDDGYFITQFDYKYDGFVSEVSQENKVSMGLNVVGMLCGIVSFVPGPVGTAAGILGLVIGGTQTAESISVMLGSGNAAIGTSVSNGQVTAVNKFTTKEGQIANYTNPQTGKPCLTKNATCMINGDDKHGNVWFKDGDNATGYFRVSHTEDWHTRLEREIALSVIDKKGNTYKENTVSQYKFTINEPAYETIDLDDSTELMLLADGDNYFKFKPKHTSNYCFAFNQADSAEVYVKTDNATEFTKATLENGNYSYRMNANTTYQIKIHSANKSISRVTMSPSLTIPSITSKSEYMVKIVPTATGAYTLAPSNTGFLIKAVYHKTENNTYDSVSGINLTLNCKDVDAVVKQGETYYMVLTNNTATEQSSDVNFTACSATLSIGSNASRKFIGGENYRYYKFELSESRVNVNFNFQGASDSNDIAFSAYDSNGNYITPTEAYYDGFLNLSNLSAGTYYIGVRVSSSVSLTPNVNKNTTKKVWKQLVGAVWKEVNNQNDILLTRGNTYYFSFWVDNTVVYSYNLIKSAGNGGVSNTRFTLVLDTTAYDYDLVTLEAIKRSPDNQNNLAYLEKLKIRPIFNAAQELNPLVIDYKNAITLTMEMPKCGAAKMTYVVQSNTYANSALTNLLSGISTSEKFEKKLLDNLCNAKATKAKFILQTLTINSGASKSQTREVTINKEYEINCMEQRYDSSTDSSYISNELHLYNLRNNTHKNKIFTNDINLVAFANWTIISSIPTGTTIDGQYYTITGMRFTVPTGSNQYYGFIGENNGIVRYLNFTGVSITGKSSDLYGNMRFGTVAAINNGRVNHCQVSGKIDVYRRDGVVGGIVAINNKSAYVENCVFGHVGNRDQNYLGNSGDIGGIVGRNYGSIQFCRTLNATIGADVDHCENSYGGIAGYMEGSLACIAACTVNGVYIKVTNSTLISGYSPNIGYVVGHMNSKSNMDSCVITNCENSITKVTIAYRKNCFNGTGGCYGKCVDSTVSRITA